PGNVRELGTTKEQGVDMSNEPVIGVRHLPSFLTGAARTEPPPSSASGTENLAPPGNLNLQDLESRAIRSALAAAGGNRTQAAELLGVSRRTLQRTLNLLQL
ncbi:MAG: sigma-54-dependent Fis family transcriptional regulator, partial [Akkermansiaceae bacterium]|nr:sigma-54-dependent Fis family transcriptional regulator [Akkermansiaceae bacterium]